MDIKFNKNDEDIKVNSGYSSLCDSMEHELRDLNYSSNSNKILSNEEEIKKIQYESTSVLSDSTEGCYSGNLTDSDKSPSKIRRRSKNLVSLYLKFLKLK